MAERWAEKYLGIPWVSRGQDWSGVDCYGLLVLVFREEFGVSIPTFPEVDPREIPEERWAEVVDAAWSEGKEEFWEPVSGDRKVGDAVELVLLGRPHCGVMVSGTEMLHASEGVGVHIVSVIRGGFCRRILNTFRLKPE